MHKAVVLTRNLHSRTERLDFGAFTISRVGLRFDELRELLSSRDVFQNDWVFEKTYAELPPAPIHSPAGVGGIPNDIEDTLLLLRLYKVGDIAFVEQAIFLPNEDKPLVQYPYRAINDLNSNSPLVSEFEQEDCEPWTAFANGLRTSQSWGSDWFTVARRFFLYGAAKEFSPTWDDVDRIVDYATALEAAVVPESEFSSRRIRHRAAMLIFPNDLEEQRIVRKLVQQIYDIRSSIVHGSKLSDEKREWLIKNCGQVELRVRQALVAAVQLVPPTDDDRRTMLAAIYDPVDQDRGDFALQTFQEIRTQEVRKAIAAKMAQLARD